MIQKLLAIISNLAALIFTGRDNEKALKQQIANRDKIIADLTAAHAADDADDASLAAAASAALEAKAKAEASLAALNAEIEAAAAKADELVSGITNDKQVPIVVDAGSGAVADAPAKGVRLMIGFNSEGGEVVHSVTTYNDTPAETLALLKERVSDPAAAAIAAATPSGKPITFDFFLNVNGENQTADSKGDDFAGLLAGQKAWLEGMLSIVNEQIAAL